MSCFTCALTRPVPRAGLREFLEEHYKPDSSEADIMKLVTRTLLEIVESGAKSIQIGVMRPGHSIQYIPESDIEEIVKGIEAEKEAEAAKKARD